MKIGKYSFGIGDRFAHQGLAQLQAIIKAKEAGISISPVWNKSNREHLIVGSEPVQLRAEADAAVKAGNWTDAYFVDADHINLNTVDKFIEASDFFTLDVADYIGKSADNASIEKFITDNKSFIGELMIPGIAQPFIITQELISAIAAKFLFAIEEAGRIYSHIAERKGADNFVTEVSMDEVNDPQTPVEMFFILKGLADQKIPAQTIAPKFTGRFNKGVDYVGDVNQFEKEFEEDILVIDYAVKMFGLPENLKLSVHSGSDKFSIYPVMGKLLRKYDKGIHVKTAGTTWLEEVIGLAIAGGDALELAKKIYIKGFEKMDELCAPYATVIDIDEAKLPTPEQVAAWTSQQFANALQHNPQCNEYNVSMRQLIHVAYKVAANLGETYTDALKQHSKIIGQQVTENIFDRHIKRLFDL